MAKKRKKSSGIAKKKRKFWKDVEKLYRDIWGPGGKPPSHYGR